MHVRKMVLKSLTIAAATGIAASASASQYPSRPISMIVSYSSGGPSDIIGRIIAERMRASLGQPVVIENIGGASGSIGTGRAARAAPDGYTLGLGSLTTHVLNAAVYALKYDVLRDFEPVSLLPSQPLMVVAKKAMPAQNLADLIAWLRANPDKALQGTSGTGAISHLAGVFFQKQTGTRYQFVPYRGTAIQDLVAGQVDMMIDQASNSLPQVQAGTIKGYAITAKTRLASAPEIPTVDEAGLPGFHVENWHAFWVPKGTPKAVIGRLNAAVVETLADPVVRARLIDLGQAIPERNQQTPEALAAYHRAEIDKWWPITKAANIKAE